MHSCCVHNRMQKVLGLSVLTECMQRPPGQMQEHNSVHHMTCSAAAMFDLRQGLIGAHASGMSSLLTRGAASVVDSIVVARGGSVATASSSAVAIVSTATIVA